MMLGYDVGMLGCKDGILGCDIIGSDPLIHPPNRIIGWYFLSFND